ncbi:HNH endonuclease signature motif containing protein [Agrococcus sp. HG114]|uniref:HNH endonuclease signature motif containing protein n=1 Tax=Agrococcus sp. HG114 TaxID=2969757 RepID=UPI00215A9205|nr:DUF222 domain-containing protein [Agrococcus sp. HG114]MCR8669628.1 DUF222 domain-containing protein [Agrococcus sp. HG114]
MAMVEAAAAAVDAARVAFADQAALSRATPQEVVDLLALTAELSRLVDAQRVRLAGAIAERSHGSDDDALSDGLGARHAREAVGKAFGLRVREAADLLSLAAATSSACSITGESIAVPFPQVGAALDAGAISLSQARAIVSTLAPAAPRADLGQLAWAERCLVDEATHPERRLVPELLQTQAQAYVAVLDPDGVLPDSERQRAMRSLRITQLPDGSWRTVVHSPAEDGAALKTALDAFTAPRVVRFRDEQAESDAGEPADRSVADTAASGDPTAPADDRSPQQKRHDALIAMVEAHVASGGAPVAGGEVPRLVLTGTIEAFDAYLRGVEHPDRSLEIEHTGSMVPIETIDRLLCDGVVQRAVTDSKGHVLDLGRTVRLFTQAQRRALAAEYGGCATPGCGFPVAWTEAHHVVWWERGGKTDTANGILLCSHCHHEVHRGRLVVIGQPGDWRVVPQLRPSDPYARTSRAAAPPREPQRATAVAASAPPPLAVRIPEPIRPIASVRVGVLPQIEPPPMASKQHAPGSAVSIEVRLRRRASTRGRSGPHTRALDLLGPPRRVVMRA